MTTIAVNKTGMACDLQATHGESLKFKVVTKVFEITNSLYYSKPFLIGYAGNLESVPDVLEFLMDTSGSMKPPKVKDCVFVALTADKRIFTFCSPTNWIVIDGPHYSIGSGSRYAMGALEAGASPKDAVKAAMKCDPMSGLGSKFFAIPK